MKFETALPEDETVSDFLTGFYLTAALVAAFGIGIQVGVASTGESIDSTVLLVMALGGLTSIGGLVLQRSSR